MVSVSCVPMIVGNAKMVEIWIKKAVELDFFSKIRKVKSLDRSGPEDLRHVTVDTVFEDVLWSGCLWRPLFDFP